MKGTAKEQLTAARTTSHQGGGKVTCWAEAIKYLLRAYDPSDAIRAEIKTLRYTGKREKFYERKQ